MSAVTPGQSVCASVNGVLLRLRLSKFETKEIFQRNLAHGFHLCTTVMHLLRNHPSSEGLLSSNFLCLFFYVSVMCTLHDVCVYVQQQVCNNDRYLVDPTRQEESALVVGRHGSSSPFVCVCVCVCVFVCVCVCMLCQNSFSWTWDLLSFFLQRFSPYIINHVFLVFGFYFVCRLATI